jgi:ferric-dicitrate binding protein FerR (iron transport regulator)
MAFSITRLLLHSSAVPPEARDALKSAMETEPEHRAVWLERALRLLHAGTDIDCDDARELVGIAQCEGCG